MKLFHRGPPTCKECGAELRLTVLPPFSGEANYVAVEFVGLQCLACPNGHSAKKYADPDFGSELIENIFPAVDMESFLSVPGTRDMAAGSQACNYCDTPFTPESLEHHALGAPLHLPHSAPFSVSVKLPMYRCLNCGTVQHVDYLRQMESDVADAITAAFDAVDLHP